MSTREVEVIYSASRGLREILVDGEELDCSAIMGRPISEWFKPLHDRSGWTGLISEIKRQIADDEAELSFEFRGPSNCQEEFSRCLEQHKVKTAEPEEDTETSRMNTARRAAATGHESTMLENLLVAAELGSAEAMRRVAICYRDGVGTEADLEIASEWLRKAAQAGDEQARDLLLKIITSDTMDEEDEETETTEKAQEDDAADEKSEYADAATDQGAQETQEAEDDPSLVYVSIIRCNAGEVLSPIAGTYVSRKSIPDEVYAEGIWGDGVGIIPDIGEDTIVAPFDGYVTAIAKGKHAIGLNSNGMEVLIHIGIDTADMDGIGFVPHVKEGDHVSIGQELITFDPEMIAAFKHDSMIVVLLTNADQMRVCECGAQAKTTENDYGGYSNSERRSSVGGYSWDSNQSARAEAERIYQNGRRYEFGNGVPKDENLAFQYYLQAAGMNHISAQYCVCACYRLGSGVKKDKKAAAKWFETAERTCRKEGTPDSLCKLGLAYLNSILTDSVDDKKAWGYFEKALALDPGSVEAHFGMGEVYYYRYISNPSNSSDLPVLGGGLVGQAVGTAAGFALAILMPYGVGMAFLLSSILGGAVAGATFSLSAAEKKRAKKVLSKPEGIAMMSYYRYAADRGHALARTKLEELSKYQ